MLTALIGGCIMIDHRILNEQELKFLLKTMDKDKNLLFYSYLTLRKEQSQFFGQFVDNQLTSVLAHLRGLPFNAFSFYSNEKATVFLKNLIEFARENTGLSKDASCNTIISDEDLKLFQTLNIVSGTPKKFIYMKHIDNDKLLECDLPVLIEKKDFNRVCEFMRASGMNYFTESELAYCPFVGIKESDEFYSVGGFHLYDAGLVEIGNIVTRPDQRGRGFGKIITSKLTQMGKEMAADVYLGVFADNAPALRVYEKLGYHPIAKLNVTDFHMNVL